MWYGVCMRRFPIFLPNELKRGNDIIQKRKTTHIFRSSEYLKWFRLFRYSTKNTGRSAFVTSNQQINYIFFYLFFIAWKMPLAFIFLFFSFFFGGVWNSIALIENYVKSIQLGKFRENAGETKEICMKVDFDLNAKLICFAAQQDWKQATNRQILSVKQICKVFNIFGWKIELNIWNWLFGTKATASIIIVMDGLSNPIQ